MWVRLTVRKSGQRDGLRCVVSHAAASAAAGRRAPATKAATQRPELMPLPEPLRVVHVRLATGDILAVSRIHEQHCGKLRLDSLDLPLHTPTYVNGEPISSRTSRVTRQLG